MESQSPSSPPDQERSFSPRPDIYSLFNQHTYEWATPWLAIKENIQKLQEANLPLIAEIGRSPLPTRFGDWTQLVFYDYTIGATHKVLVFGNLDNGALDDGQNILVRIHSACHTDELFHATNCNCRQQLDQTLAEIAAEGRGVLIYLDQEGRGNGDAAKCQQLSLMFTWDGNQIVPNIDPHTGEPINISIAFELAGYQPESRNFTVAGEMLKRLQIKSARLLTDNPHKIAGVEAAGILVIS